MGPRFQTIIVLLSLAVSTFASSGAPAETSLAKLQQGFRDPAMDCRPYTYWWWLGNAITPEEITWEMEQMCDKGIGGVLITSAAPTVYEKGNTEFLSEKHRAAIRHAVLTAKRLGMKVYLNFASGWAFGGSWLPAEDRSKSLVPAHVDLQGPSTYSDLLPTFQKASDRRGEIRVDDIPDTSQLVAVVAGRVVEGKVDPSTLVTLTDEVVDDRLTWTVPKGTWRLAAFRLRPTGQRSHDEHWTLDHFNKTAVERYCNHLGGIFEQIVGDEFGKTVEAFHCDSFELANLPGGIYWSDDLMAAFERHHGYDLTPYLLAIWWEVGELSPKIRYDVSETLQRAGFESFFEPFLTWCEKHGVQGSMEPIGFPTDVIESAGRAPRPMLEITPGEKDGVPWFDTRIGPKKYISSGAHLYGRRMVAVEAYTYLHWELYRSTLEELKIAGDGFFRSGANRFINHGYSHSPERDIAPSRSIPFAARISHPNVWWEHYPLLAEYVARCSYLLRQGEFAPDVAIYSPLANQWSLDVLNARKWTRDFDWGGLGNLLIANGYDFDLLNDDIIQNRAKIVDGKIVVRGLEYKVLILPNIETLPLETMRFIERYVREGGVAIALEKIPSRSTGFLDHAANDREVQASAKRLFKKRRFGEGTTYSLEIVMDRSNVLERKSSALDPFLNAIRAHIAPDFGIDFAREGLRENKGLTFIHRQLQGNVDLYFVTNIQDRASEIPITFRVTGKTPRQWNPYNGEVSDIHTYRKNQHGTEIALKLPPYASTFVLFEPGEENDHVEETNFERILQVSVGQIEALASKNGAHFIRLPGRDRIAIEVEALPAPHSVNGEWKMTLAGQSFPEVKKKMQHLASWTTDPETESFSGTGRYELEFDLPADKVGGELRWFLDMGKVGNIAEVELNGTLVGTRWMRGQTLDVTAALRSGHNRLVILVTNTLINRASHLKEPPPVPEALVPYYGSGLTPYSASRRGPIGFKPLPASGLIGPVVLQPFKHVTVPLQ